MIKTASIDVLQTGLFMLSCTLLNPYVAMETTATQYTAAKTARNEKKSHQYSVCHTLFVYYIKSFTFNEGLLDNNKSLKVLFITDILSQISFC